MVRRIYVEKKEALRHEAAGLLNELKNLLGLEALTGLRLINRYDVESIDEALFEDCKGKVFSEPQLDIVTTELEEDGAYVFAVEYLPGQFDQRADSAAQCIQMLCQGDQPTVKYAKIYILSGNITDDDIRKRVAKTKTSVA